MVSRLTVGAMVLALVVVCVRADEEKVPLDKVPQAVKDAVKKKFPKEEMVSASTEKDEAGKQVYEIQLKTSKKQNIDVTVTPEGKIVLVEKEIDAKELPKAVAMAMFNKYPKATVKLAEELSKDDKITAYEMIIVTADKKTLEVEFAPDGKFVKEEEKKEEEKKDATKDKKKDK
jgi:hypothetical protein